VSINNKTTDFDDWFSTLQMHVLDNTGVEFRNIDAAKEDYEQGRDVFDVVDEITAEYQ